MFARALVIVIWLATSALAAEPRQGAITVDIRWSGVPLRATLEKFAKQYGRGLALDRRVDPGQTIELTLEGAGVEHVFDEAARSVKLAATKVGPIEYVGPPSAAAQLRALVALRNEEVQEFSAKARTVWLTSKAWKYDDLAMPRELVSRLASEAQVTVTNPDMIPHDLWAGADWPAASLVERLSVVLAQFDLTFTFESPGNAIRLVTIPAGLPVLAAAPPGKPPPAAAATKGTQLHTLNVDNVPLDGLLATLGKRLGLTVEIDRNSCSAAGVKLDQLVSLHVERLSTDELFKRLVEPLSLGFHREGTTIKVFAKKRD